MKTSKVVTSVATGLGVIVAMSGSAAAWTYSMSGTGKCQPNGSYKITWVVDNTTENEPLNVTLSSNPAVVKTGAVVAKNAVANYSQVVDGTKPGVYSLELTAAWQTDTIPRSKSATVMLKQPCAQPVQQPVQQPTTPVVAAAATTTPSTPAPQVKVPTAPVNAGGGYQPTNAATVAGLAGSLTVAVLGLGLLVRQRFGKQNG